MHYGVHSNMALTFIQLGTHKKNLKISNQKYGSSTKNKNPCNFKNMN
jgi:hypothetical protein